MVRASMAGDVHDRGVCVTGGMHGRWHVWQGVCVARTPIPPPVDRMTDACKNITLPPT